MGDGVNNEMEIKYPKCGKRKAGIGEKRMSETANCESYTTKDVARLMGVSVKTIMKLRRRKDGPPFKKVGPKIIRYPKHLFHAWLNNLG